MEGLATKMIKSFLPLAVACVLNLGCTNIPAPKTPCPVCPEMSALKEQLVQQGQLPHPSAWPQVLSTGSYGFFVISDPALGKMLRLKVAPFDGEEQFFIISQAQQNVRVKLEGKGLRQIGETGSHSIIIYTPPKDPEERKKAQRVIISTGNKRFVILFRPYL